MLSTFQELAELLRSVPFALIRRRVLLLLVRVDLDWVVQ